MQSTSLSRETLEDGFNLTMHRILMARYTKPNPITPIKELQSKKLGSMLKQDKLGLFELLFQWRERFARIWDGKPNEYLSTAKLVQLANSDPPPRSAGDLIRLIGARGNMPQPIAGQESTLLQIIEKGIEFIGRINNTECHNCLQLGHAAAHCPFPPNPDRWNEYCNKHPEARDKRRFLGPSRYEEWAKRKGMTPEEAKASLELLKQRKVEGD